MRVLVPGAAAIAAAGLAAGIPHGTRAGDVTPCSVTHVRGDFDGDGRGDIARVYSTARGGRCVYAGRFRVVISLATGARVERRLGPPIVDPDDTNGSTCPDGCKAFAAPELDRDGRTELAIELWHGASQVGIGVFTLDGNAIRRAGVGGRPLDLRLYGSTCCGADVACRANDLVVQGSYGVDARAIHIWETTYRFDGHDFILVRRTHRSTPSSSGLPTLRGRRCLVDSGGRR